MIWADWIEDRAWEAPLRRAWKKAIRRSSYRSQIGTGGGETTRMRSKSRTPRAAENGTKDSNVWTHTELGASIKAQRSHQKTGANFGLWDKNCRKSRSTIEKQLLSGQSLGQREVWERLLLCEQGAEKLRPCFKASVVYENICQTCNPGTETDKEQVEIRSDIPTWEKRAVASMKEWWMTGEPRTKRLRMPKCVDTIKRNIDVGRSKNV